MTEPKTQTKTAIQKSRTILADDALWYKDAVIYEVHVRAFYDSDGDGIGDFRGLTQKLDYLQNLGVTAIWLLPFYPSPLKDDGYDISDYTDIHPAYGTLRDFNFFLREAHRRGLRVITELVINHTSSDHAWFQRARREKADSPYRNFYVWSDTPEKYKDARIIFKDFESSNWTWDAQAQAYYWHRFYFHQPDLNFENPLVRKAVRRVLDFWLGMGVDGMRLDAVPYLLEREGTSCENLPETHHLLKEIRSHIDQKYKNRMLLAEANQWPEDASAYFGDGDECHMSFHFPLMPRLFMALRMESRQPITDILEQTPQIPESSQWAIFLRNHDELTLEMVTDEERDYMYRAYAQDQEMRINLGIRRRLAPLLGHNRRSFELLNGLLLSLPGTPVIYYGDEVGMGDNVYLGDRNGVRTPMQWSADRNAGFSKANPQKLFLPVVIDPNSHFETVNVETQEKNPHSILSWMKRIMTIRSRFKAFGRGTFKFLSPENPKVFTFIRCYQDEVILVVANLSRFAQYAEIDLSAYKGTIPVELFGRTPFPRVGDLPYLVTLGPHAFYWFSLGSSGETQASLVATEVKVPMLEVSGRWESVFQRRGKRELEELLPKYLKNRRWFAAKARTILDVEIEEVVSVSADAVLTMICVNYADGEPEHYLLPLAYVKGEKIQQIKEEFPGVILVALHQTHEEGLLCDALYVNDFCRTLLDAISGRRVFKGHSGTVTAIPTPTFRTLGGLTDVGLEPRVSDAEQSNSSIIYGEVSILKIFRRVQPGMNPDLEIGKFITEKTGFKNTPTVAGFLQYRKGRHDEPITLGFLQGYVANQGDAWRHTLEHLSRYFERALAYHQVWHGALPPRKALLDLMNEDIHAAADEAIGSYLESAALLGTRTAELHLALASSHGDPAFDPEPFTPFYQRSLYQSMRGQATQAMRLLRRRLGDLDSKMRVDIEHVLSKEKDILSCFDWLPQSKLSSKRIRCHGDYHLGQVLYTGSDFIIIDFEGEPARSLSERRLKRSPLQDVAGMIRSFHYAASVAFLTHTQEGVNDMAAGKDPAKLEPWIQFWYEWVSTTFLKAYFEKAKGSVFFPASREELKHFLDAYLMEKACYELSYELNHRPDWVKIPLQGITHLLSSGV